MPLASTFAALAGMFASFTGIGRLKSSSSSGPTSQGRPNPLPSASGPAIADRLRSKASVETAALVRVFALPPRIIQSA
jgi:hypothetical protein